MISSVSVISEEEKTALRRNAEALERGKDEVLEWLLVQRDHYSSVAAEEMKKDKVADYSIINPAVEMSNRYGEAADEVKKLRRLCDLMTESLRGRVLVALAEAKAPPWEATHVHYKGTKYRFLRVVSCADHEELEPMVEYDDEEGRVFVLSKHRWESLTGSGTPRYRYVGIAR